MNKLFEHTRAIVRRLVLTQQWNGQPTQQERRVTMVLSICLVGIFSFSANGFMAMAAQKRALFIVELGMTLILALIMLEVHLFKKMNPLRGAFFLVFSLGLSFIYLFFSSDLRGSGLLWYLFYPLMATFLLGPRPGAFVILLLMVVTLVLNYVVAAPYGAEFLFKFFSAYAAVGALSYAVERVRAGTENQLILKNNRLNSMIEDFAMIEQSLRDSRERYRDLLETVMDWIWEIDQHGTFTYSSPQVKNILGLEPKDVVGKRVSAFMQSEDRLETDRLTIEFMAQKKSFTGMQGIFLNQKGHRVIIESNGIPFFDAAGNLMGFRGVARDITIRQEVEKEHAERTKLQGALELAGAVCHELNQPMMAVNGYAELLMEKKDIYPAISDSLDKIRKQTERMGAITRKLMGITRYETRKYGGGETIMDIEKSSHTQADPQIRSQRLAANDEDKQR